MSDSLQRIYRCHVENHRLTRSDLGVRLLGLGAEYIIICKNKKMPRFHDKAASVVETPFSKLVFSIGTKSWYEHGLRQEHCANEGGIRR
jgi:hypothetical protein